MRNLFARHQEALTASEKDELWSEMQRELSRDSRSGTARAAETRRTVRSLVSGSPFRFSPMPWPAMAAVGLVAVIAIALIVGHPWDRMRPAAPGELAESPVIATSDSGRVTRSEELTSPGIPLASGGIAQKQGAGQGGAVPGSDSTKNALPATVPARNSEPAAVLTQNRELSTNPARSLVPTADPTQNRALTAGSTPNPAPYIRSAPKVFPPSLTTQAPQAGPDGGPSRNEPGSAAAGGRSQMAAVTPTEQAPSPSAGQSRTGRPRPDSASAPPLSEPRADATGGRPTATTDAGPTADQASRRPDSVVVVAGGTATVSFALAEKPTTLSEVEIMASRERMKLKSTRTIRLDLPSDHQDLPVSDIKDLIGLKAGVVTGSTGLHIRGGRAESVQIQADGVPGPSAPSANFGAPAPDGTPRVPTTGGTTLPNDEVYDSMFFEHYGVNPFIATDEDPLSTFAVDVDAASYTVTRRYIEGGHLPDKDAVRVEEFVNYFKQDYPQFNDTDFRIMIDGAPSPFGHGYQLLRVGIKARDIAAVDRKPANLVFVIDISGSMEREDRLELVKRSLRVLVDRLAARDRIGIVVYGSEARVLLEPISLGSDTRDDVRPDGFAGRGGWKNPPRRDSPSEMTAPSPAREQIMAAIDNLGPDGATNAEAGLLLGYEMARGILQDGSINRIILCSDGVANIGNTGPESILDRARGEADRGIQITTIGFGMGNYNDVLMEQLADRGDGNYYYVDEIGEANRVLAENLTTTLQTVARDAKIQVEFDPRCVQRYRLLGFENRDVADRDFRNDKVDAGEIGAGHEVTALYEVRLSPGVDRGRIVTVRFRYLPPDRKKELEPKAREMEQSFDLSELQRSFSEAPARFRLDAAVAEFAEILRHSFWAKESQVADVLPVARSAAADLPQDVAVREFVELVERAVGLVETLSPEEQRGIQGR